MGSTAGDYAVNRKVVEFTQAMEKYLRHRLYKRVERTVSILVLSLQFITVLSMLYTYQDVSFFMLIGVLMVSYLATDFINGLVHMYMDNNLHYQASIAGPFIAAFHMHHLRGRYQTLPLFKVYFYESGTKFWLLFYLVILVTLQFHFHLNGAFNVGLVSFGIFSSLAEVSHYCCHNATPENTVIQWLQKNRILLSREHHKTHHRFDNTQYAFLNGLTDPLLNGIARQLYNQKGYQNNADSHAKAYARNALPPLHKTLGV